jgi:hypothetical protein
MPAPLLPGQPDQSEGDEEDNGAGNDEVHPRSPLALLSLPGKMAWVYAHHSRLTTLIEIHKVNPRCFEPTTYEVRADTVFVLDAADSASGLPRRASPQLPALPLQMRLLRVAR